MVFAFFMFGLGIYFGWMKWHIDPIKRIAELTSCSEYDEGFLNHLGYKTHDECSQLNLLRVKDFYSECENKIGRVTNLKERQYKILSDNCVYHLFEVNDTNLFSEHIRYFEGKSK